MFTKLFWRSIQFQIWCFGHVSTMFSKLFMEQVNHAARVILNKIGLVCGKCESNVISVIIMHFFKKVFEKSRSSILLRKLPKFEVQTNWWKRLKIINLAMRQQKICQKVQWYYLSSVEAAWSFCSWPRDWSFVMHKLNREAQKMLFKNHIPTQKSVSPDCLNRATLRRSAATKKPNLFGE